MTGAGLSDTFRSADGNDTLEGKGGNDTLEGGIGDDVYKATFTMMEMI